MFGIGYKYPQGTIASFVTCLIYLFLIVIFEVNFYILWLIFFIVLVYSLVLIEKLSKHFKGKDPKEIVIDEFLGQSIPIITIWGSDSNFFGNEERYLLFFLIAFISFRLFDIFKPFPINIVDKKMKNNFGIVFDDIIAGIYSTIIVYIIFIKL
jgi:phosphatidylglycerophosphatase A